MGSLQYFTDTEHRMSTVAILGAGPLGGAIAQALASRRSASRIVLIDPAGQMAAGKALDIQQAGAVNGGVSRLHGSADTSAAIGCDVCVVAESDGAELVARAALDVGRAPLVFAGATQHDLIRGLALDRGVHTRRLIGSVPEALTAAVRAMVAAETGRSVTEVHLSVLGRTPDGVVVPWVEASLGGCSLEKVMSQAELARVDARLPHLWPPGPYTLGLAAADVVDAILRSSHRPRSVLCMLDGEYGVRQRVGVLPAWLGPHGIERTAAPQLNTRERVQVESALER
jgi:malate dehydrogenase